MKKKLTINNVKNLDPFDKVYDVRDTDISGFALRVRPTGTKTYLLFYRNQEGKKRTHTIGRGLTATQARQIAEKRYAEIKSGIDINERDREVKEAAKKQDQLKFESFLENTYKEWLLEHRASGKHAYNRLKNSFAMLAKKDIDSIVRFDMERWRKKRKAQGVSNATIKNDLSELKAMLNKARIWGHIPMHQLTDYTILNANSKRIVRYLSEEERERLFKALEERENRKRAERLSANEWREERGYKLFEDYAGYTDHLMPMVLLALNTGMRRGEIFHLEWDDINFQLNTLTIRPEIAKSNKERHIPLNEKVLKVIAIWTKDKSRKGLVFPSLDGEPFDNIYKSWTKLLEEAQIESFRFHDLRHDFASRLVMNGVDLYTVKELLGHSTIQITERYAHLAPEKLAEAVNLI